MSKIDYFVATLFCLAGLVTLGLGQALANMIKEVLL